MYTGLYSGTLLTTEDGRFFYVLEEHGGGSYATSTVAVGNLTVAGSMVSGSEQTTDFLSTQCVVVPVSCASGPAMAVSGSISQRSTLTLDGYTWTYDVLYDDPSSLATTLGTWSTNLAAVSYATFVRQGTLDVSSNGVLYEQDPTTNCLVTGQLSLINPSYNAYAIALTYTGADCASGLNGATGSGIAYIDDLGQLNIGVNMPSASEIVEGMASPNQTIGGIWTAASVPAGKTGYMISDEGGLAFFRAADSTCTDTYDTVFFLGNTPGGFIGGSLSQMLPISCGGVGDNGFYLFFDSTALTLSAQDYNTSVTTDFNLIAQSVAYNQPSSAASVAGNWTTPGGDVIAVDGSGAMAATDTLSGCTVTGQIASANPAYNIYYLTLHYSGCTAVPADLAPFTTDSAGLNGAVVTGLATIDNSVTPNQLDLWYRIDNSDGSGTSAIIYFAATSH